MNEIIDSYCGLSCEKCEYKEVNQCGGCIATKGKPFHGKCEIAECAKQRGIAFCGECAEFPCSVVIRYSNDEIHGDNPKGARIERCKYLKETLVKEARRGIEPVGYCGHHCDYCWLGKWCGGCRSNYNCCSFATLFEDKKCPNVTCVKEKNLNGCYECDLLVSCEKGYYSNKEEYVAKATALFINEYGLEVYKNVLAKAINNGINYPKTFDESESIENALKILKKYI